MTGIGPLADEQTHDFAFSLAALRGALSELRDYLPTVLNAIPDGETLQFGASGSAIGELRRGRFPPAVLDPDLDSLEVMHDFVQSCVAHTMGCRDADDAVLALHHRYLPAAATDGDIAPYLRERRTKSYAEILAEIAEYAAQLLLALNARELHDMILLQQQHREGQAKVIRGLLTFLQ